MKKCVINFLSLCILCLTTIQVFGQASVFKEVGTLLTDFQLCTSTATINLNLTCGVVMENTQSVRTYTGTLNQTITELTTTTEFFNIKLKTPTGLLFIGNVNVQGTGFKVTPNLSVEMKAGAGGYIKFTNNARNTVGFPAPFISNTTSLIEGSYSIKAVRQTLTTKSYSSNFVPNAIHFFDPDLPANTTINNETEHNSNPIQVFFGYGPPVFSINNKTQEKVILLDGCEPTVKLKVNNPNNCATDVFILSIQEINPLGITSGGSFPSIGPEIFRPLTPAELIDIISLQGLALVNNSFSNGNGQTITIQPGKTYYIKLIYPGGGIYKATYKVLQYKSGTYDLMMKDFAEDEGFEPSVNLWSSKNVFNSPDLWNLSTTNSANNPDFVDIPTNSNKIITRIKNIGCATSIPSSLRVFWTMARTDEIWNKDWEYNLTFNGVWGAGLLNTLVPLGSEITVGMPNLSYQDPFGTANGANSFTNSSPYIIPALAAGAEFVVPSGAINWFPPNPIWYTSTNGSNQKFENDRPLLCLLARINEKNTAIDPISWEPTGTSDKIKPYSVNNNNVVTRNMQLYNDEVFFQANGSGWNYGVGSVKVQDPGYTRPTGGAALPKRSLCLELLDAQSLSTSFTNYGTIEVILSDGLWNSWAANGYKGSNFTYNVSNPGSVWVIDGSKKLQLDKIEIDNGAKEKMGLRFNYSGSNLPVNPINMVYNTYVSQFDTVPGDSNFVSADNLFSVTVPANTFGQPNDFTGVREEYSSGLELSVFPNPANNVVVIQLTARQASQSTGTIVISDAIGKIIQEIDNLNNEFVHSIDSKNLKDGVYFVKYQNEHSTLVKKFVITH